jgi:hypothetical protein
VLLGALMGMLPDLLQFIYGQIGTRLLALIQTIHNAFHTKHKLIGRPGLGFVSQAFIVGLVLLAVIIF